MLPLHVLVLVDTSNPQIFKTSALGLTFVAATAAASGIYVSGKEAHLATE